MTTRFWDHSVPACRALQTRLGQIRADFLMVMSARDRMKASDAKRLALRKAVLSQWTEQLEIAGNKNAERPTLTTLSKHG